MSSDKFIIFAFTAILLFMSAMTEVFLPMLKVVPPDHPLVKLISIWPKRMGACNKVVDTLSSVKKLIGMSS